MSNLRRPLWIVAAAVIALAACTRVPSSVIPPDEMASLMADIHVAEAVIDYNRSIYNNDSTMQALKQSVFAAHGVTTEQLDTSLAWYGRHLDMYMDVYDRTIELLDERLAEAGSRVAAETAMSMAGDSVDVWQWSRRTEISRMSPSRTLTFNLQRDFNWEEGDSYTWRFKMLNVPGSIVWGIVAEYADGWLEATTSYTSREGWNDLTLITDSTRQTQRIYGFATFVPEGDRPIWLDSIALVRNRIDASRYYRRAQQRRVPVRPIAR